jgi:hypothetical protein
MEAYEALLRHAQAERGLAHTGPFLALAGVQVAASAWIAWAIFGTLLGSTCRMRNLGSAAITGIDEICLLKLLQISVIVVQSLALYIGGIWPTAIRSLIPIQAKPAQVVKHSFSRSGSHAWKIEILDAQNEATLLNACAQPG